MASPPALVRLFEEFEKGYGKPDVTRLNGIYHNKRGYHNKPVNLPGSDYSLQHSRDKAGARRYPTYGSAIDINFENARLRSDFRDIAVVSNRLLVASRNRDPRLVKAIREWFGNADLDRQVEGWTFWRTASPHSAGAASSDSTHLFHIHLSFWRDTVNDWNVVKGVLDVMLGRDINTPEDDDMPIDDADARKIAKAVWEHNLKAGGAAPLAGWPADFDAPARGYLVGKDAAQTAILRNQAAMIKALGAIATKVDALDEELGNEIREAIEGAQFVADIDVIQNESPPQ